MGTEANNLCISEPLLHKLCIVVPAECTTVVDLVQNLLADALDKRDIDQLFSSMQAHARLQGLSEADVEPELARKRDDERLAALNRSSRDAFESGFYDHNRIPQNGSDE
jgi:hypothetical protein